jgi:hypothetical protein
LRKLWCKLSLLNSHDLINSHLTRGLATEWRCRLNEFPNFIILPNYFFVWLPRCCTSRIVQSWHTTHHVYYPVIQVWQEHQIEVEQIFLLRAVDIVRQVWQIKTFTLLKKLSWWYENNKKLEKHLPVIVISCLDTVQGFV